MYRRDYMRRGIPQTEFEGLKWIIIFTVAMFIFQEIFQAGKGAPVIEKFFALSPSTLSSGFVWTFITYGFLHGSFMHILLNMLAIFFVGRILEPFLGTKRFLQLYFFSIFSGGVIWMLLNLTSPSTLVGASAAAFGLLTFFCFLEPERPITLLLFFILPVTIKPKFILWGMLGIELFLMLFYEIPGRTVVASSAHLGGMLMGFIFYQSIVGGRMTGLFHNIKIEKPKWLKKSGSSKKTASHNYSVNVQSKQELKDQVDKILDKINSDGFGSLSEDEKKLLDDAKAILDKKR